MELRIPKDSGGPSVKLRLIYFTCFHKQVLFAASRRSEVAESYGNKTTPKAMNKRSCKRSECPDPRKKKSNPSGDPARPEQGRKRKKAGYWRQMAARGVTG